ncbi:hypothetical protein [Cupriavidus necator]|uniref:hypothetical protein n=1 Tax=Cupriavidus necator TaxID=106590 RepID=UPI0012D30035|nr:hypothetical protein [Cupriavidus necator]
MGTRLVPRWDADWRLFDGPLSRASQMTACAILNGLCTWLASQRYLHTNPFDGVPKLTLDHGSHSRDPAFVSGETQ